MNVNHPRFGAAWLASQVKRQPNTNMFSAAEAFEAYRKLEQRQREIRESENPRRIGMVEIYAHLTPGVPEDEGLLNVVVTDEDYDEYAVTVGMQGENQAKLELYRKITNPLFKMNMDLKAANKKQAEALSDREGEELMEGLVPRLADARDWQDPNLTTVDHALAGMDLVFRLDGHRYTLRDVWEINTDRLDPLLEAGQFVLHEKPHGTVRAYRIKLDTYKRLFPKVHQAARPALAAQRLGKITGNLDSLSGFRVSGAPGFLSVRFETADGGFSLSKRETANQPTVYELSERYMPDDRELERLRVRHNDLLETLSQENPQVAYEPLDADAYRKFYRENMARFATTRIEADEYERLMSAIRAPLDAALHAEFGIAPGLDVRPQLRQAAEKLLRGDIGFRALDSSSFEDVERLNVKLSDAVEAEFRRLTGKGPEQPELRYSLFISRKEGGAHFLPITDEKAQQTIDLLLAYGSLAGQVKHLDRAVNPSPEDLAARARMDVALETMLKGFGKVSPERKAAQEAKAREEEAANRRKLAELQPQLAQLADKLRAAKDSL